MTAVLAVYSGYNVSGKLQDGRKIHKFSSHDEATDDANRILQAIAEVAKDIRSANEKAASDLESTMSQVRIGYRAIGVTHLVAIIEKSLVECIKPMIEKNFHDP